MVFCVFIFFESYLITAMLKFLLNNQEAHKSGVRIFERHPAVEYLWK